MCQKGRRGEERRGDSLLTSGTKASCGFFLTTLILLLFLTFFGPIPLKLPFLCTEKRVRNFREDKLVLFLVCFKWLREKGVNRCRKNIVVLTNFSLFLEGKSSTWVAFRDLRRPSAPTRTHFCEFSNAPPNARNLSEKS